MSLLTRTDQKFLSFTLSSLWKLMPGLEGLSCRSNAVVLTAFCSSPVRRARLSVNVSAIRNSTGVSMLSELQHTASDADLKRDFRVRISSAIRKSADSTIRGNLHGQSQSRKG